jgi:hypothetical protein
MEQLIHRCVGIDVGQAAPVVCVRVPDAVTGDPAELIASAQLLAHGLLTASFVPPPPVRER